MELRQGGAFFLEEYMKAVELDKNYKPEDFEDRIYQEWMDKGCFKPAGDDSKDPFVIVIPPPNVTGVLHMGHGLNNSLQDVLIRYYRMQQRPTLWVPGTDHAGIATQNVVERKLLKEGKNRRDMGREKFLEETWKVKEEHHTIITRQLMKIGASCDWSRERFTMDEGLSKAVREVFVTLYERDLLYKGEYLVNWCPSCGTALADDEVDHEEVQGKLFDIAYPLSDGSGEIVVSTTRPETMFGDTAVAVHPDDERYKHLVGQTVDLPLTNRKIKIIADTYCRMDFGSGAVKMTPAHDPNDWEVGRRHDLEKINVLNPDATMNENTPENIQGLTTKEARKQTLKDLEAGGFLRGDKDNPHQVGHCYRCNTTVEPYMSDQWFVRMGPMAEKAIKAWEKDEIRFYPKKWENTYNRWLEGIRDWCISRQLWWGHRIPAWTCTDCGEFMVSRTDLTACTKCGSTKIDQDPDVLDTWFSSWLWPFSTLGWPEKTPDLEKFFATTALVTGYDIIFFWVARMIMASLEFMGEVPFTDIYMTGLVRDAQGRKMSKSLGNGLDPLEIVDQYGADAMKFTLVYLSGQGEDIPVGLDTFQIGSKFCNKIWNATRYILMNLEGRELIPMDQLKLKTVDKWIYHRLNEAVKNMETSFESYRFDAMGHRIYEYFWNDFCDWYVEASKLYLYSDDEAEKNRAVTVILNVLEESLRFMHPFLSFLTEEIYSRLPNTEGKIITAWYPQVKEDRENPALAANFELLQDLVQKVRTLRSEFTIPPSKKIKLAVRCDKDLLIFFEDASDLIASLVKAEQIEFTTTEKKIAGAVTAVGKGFEAHALIRDLIDLDKEMGRMKKTLEKNRQMLGQTEKKLSNERFTSRAPAEVIAKEKDKLEEFKQAITKMEAYLKDLS
jgi:valyl-tRNA synthetase